VVEYLKADEEEPFTVERRDTPMAEIKPPLTSP
jgi:hypothetical protein